MKNLQHLNKKNIDFDFRNYLKEIIFIGVFFGFIMNIIQNYGNESIITKEYTEEMFRLEVFYGITGPICIFFAIFATIFSIKIDYKKYIIDYDRSFLKYLLFFVIFVVFVSICFIKIELTVVDIFYCVFKMLMFSSIGFFSIGLICKLYSKSMKKF